MSRGRGRGQSQSRDQAGGGRGDGGGEQTKMVPCKSRYFSAVEDPDTAEFADYQEIKVQETFKTLRPGLIPRSINVIL